MCTVLRNLRKHGGKITGKRALEKMGIVEECIRRALQGCELSTVRAALQGRASRRHASKNKHRPAMQAGRQAGRQRGNLA